jgi:hypothetical protein
MNNYRQSMADFIAGKGWEPLGYASFTQVVDRHQS